MTRKYRKRIPITPQKLAEIDAFIDERRERERTLTESRAIRKLVIVAKLVQKIVRLQRELGVLVTFDGEKYVLSDKNNPAISVTVSCEEMSKKK